ncbi:MAG: hypothetical protein ACRD3W_06235, partial [Terriglobales bacterium]
GAPPSRRLDARSAGCSGAKAGRMPALPGSWTNSLARPLAQRATGEPSLSVTVPQASAFQVAERFSTRL